MHLMIDALKEAAAWRDSDQRTRVLLASQLMAAELYQEGVRGGHPGGRDIKGAGRGSALSQEKYSACLTPLAGAKLDGAHLVIGAATKRPNGNWPPCSGGT